MQVDAAIFGHMQKLRRNNAAVSYHDNNIGCQAFDQLIRAAIAQGARLINRDAVGHSRLFDRRGGQNLFAANWLICAGKHSADIVPGGNQSVQTFGSNIRGAHKEDTHRSYSFSYRKRMGKLMYKAGSILRIFRVVILIKMGGTVHDGNAV